MNAHFQLNRSKLDKQLVGHESTSSNSVYTRTFSNKGTSAHLKEIEFGIFTAQDVTKLSHVHIKHRNLYRFNTQIP